jgi:hypothetical protein
MPHRTAARNAGIMAKLKIMAKIATARETISRPSSQHTVILALPQSSLNLNATGAV